MTSSSKIGDFGYSVVELVAVMGIIAVLTSIFTYASMVSDRNEASRVKIESTRVKNFLNLASQRAYFTGLCTTLTWISERKLRIQSWSTGNTNCDGPLSDQTGETLNLELQESGLSLGMFQMTTNLGTIPAPQLVFTRTGGIFTVEAFRAEIKILSSSYTKTLKVIPAVGQVTEGPLERIVHAGY